MSFARNYLPLGFAIVFGVANGYYAFQPFLKEQQEKSGSLPKSGQQAGPIPNDTTSR